MQHFSICQGSVRPESISLTQNLVQLVVPSFVFPSFKPLACGFYLPLHESSRHLAGKKGKHGINRTTELANKSAKRRLYRSTVGFSFSICRRRMNARNPFPPAVLSGTAPRCRSMWSRKLRPCPPTKSRNMHRCFAERGQHGKPFSCSQRGGPSCNGACIMLPEHDACWAPAPSTCRHGGVDVSTRLSSGSCSSNQYR